MPSGREPWSVELGQRVRSGFVRTFISTSLLTGLFFLAYFWIQQHPSTTPTVMPLTQLDTMIPFQPLALLAYVSLWIYVGFGPGLQRSTGEFAVYSLWLAGLCITGLVIFYFWPTQAPVPMVSVTRFPGFATLRHIDEASNACPSMHVAVAIFTAVRVGELLRAARVPRALRVFNITWCVVIVYSTLAIKQHVVVDAVAGASLGVAFALMSLRWRPALGTETAFVRVPVAS